MVNLKTYSAVAPVVNISMETVAIQGNPLTLSCNAIGQPSPSVTWFRGPAQIQGDSRLMVDERGRLVFSAVMSTDADVYSCTASNGVGTASANTQLTVQGRQPIGVGSGGGRGGDSPPQVSSWGGIAPPTLPTVYIMNFIAVL